MYKELMNMAAQSSLSDERHSERMLRLRGESLREWMMGDESRNPEKYWYYWNAKWGMASRSRGLVAIKSVLSYSRVKYEARMEDRQVQLPFGNVAAEIIVPAGSERGKDSAA